jgi:DNA ligase-1
MNPDAFHRRRLLAACALLPLAPLLLPIAAAARPARGALPLLLAQEAAPDVDPEGFLVSEKLDGARAFWDGERLRFRSGLGVAAPAGFLQRLPPVALDGELWLGRGRFEQLSGIVRRQRPDETDWRDVRYMVFELPGGSGSFVQRAGRLAELARSIAWPSLQAVAQAPVAGRAGLQRRLAEVLRVGGEGLVLHRADAPYVNGRSPVLLKLKPVHDAEALVLGHVPGRGRHAGRMGALRVRTSDGRDFLLGTGFSDAQRDAPPVPGSIVTYTHQGLTGAGLPRFASFLRLHEP